MKDETEERLFQLCQRAAVEQDPEKLLALFKEIDELTQAKEARFEAKAQRPIVPRRRNDSGR